MQLQKGNFLLPKGDNLLHSGQILPRQPTHLPSHFLLLDFYFLMEQAKVKERASNRTTVDNIVQTGQRTEKGGQPLTAGLRKLRVQWYIKVSAFYYLCSSLTVLCILIRNFASPQTVIAKWCTRTLN